MPANTAIQILFWRVGECAAFFINICQTQSINNLKNFIITPKYSSSAFLVKTWTIRDPNEPQDQGGMAQGSHDRPDKPLNIFWDHVFVKYNNRYYDPSYGLMSTKSFGSDKDLLNDYTSLALSGVVYVKPDASGENINDALHTGSLLDPLLKFGGSSPTGYIYHTETSSMADHLLIV